jgi:hypothetical protein
MAEIMNTIDIVEMNNTTMEVVSEPVMTTQKKTVKRARVPRAPKKDKAAATVSDSDNDSEVTVAENLDTKFADAETTETESETEAPKPAVVEEPAAEPAPKKKRGGPRGPRKPKAPKEESNAGEKKAAAIDAVNGLLAGVEALTVEAPAKKRGRKPKAVQFTIPTDPIGLTARINKIARAMNKHIKIIKEMRTANQEAADKVEDCNEMFEAYRTHVLSMLQLCEDEKMLMEF